MIYCKQCGQIIENETLIKCPKCNTGIGKGGRFCAVCGKKLVQGEKCECQGAIIKKCEKDIDISSEKCEIDRPLDVNKSNVVSDVVGNSNFSDKKSADTPSEPPVSFNSRIAGNPLFEKIAQGNGGNERSKQIIEEEAVKIVYGKNMTVEKLQSQALGNDDKVSDAHSEENAANKSVEISKNDLPTVERVNNKNDIFPQTNNTNHPGVINNIHPQTTSTTPSLNVPEQRVVNTNTPASVPIQSPILPQPQVQNVSNNKVEDSAKIFPQAFSQQNMQYNRSYDNVQHGLTSGTVKQGSVQGKKKKVFDGMWLVGLIATVASLNTHNNLWFYIYILVSFIFGIIDVFLNERKTGVGIILGNVFLLVMRLLEGYGGV